ncbi:transmembrane protein, putative [Medicago truncatula]|uniref:Transmembrane protein, putative n=1 Tax=Medicago truncatula TaxID=3880 RepID=A0A072UXH4_MEDTR|nr:transmembrane protein, putative [Medicago truncatula]
MGYRELSPISGRVGSDLGLSCRSRLGCLYFPLDYDFVDDYPWESRLIIGVAVVVVILNIRAVSVRRIKVVVDGMVTVVIGVVVVLFMRRRFVRVYEEGIRSRLRRRRERKLDF